MNILLSLVSLFILEMSVFGDEFRGSNLKNPVPIVFESSARSGGSNENLEISINTDITRVRKFTIGDASIPISYYAINQGNILINVRATVLNGPLILVALHLTPGTYTISEMVDEVRGKLSEQQIEAVFRYDDIQKKFYFELNNYENTSHSILTVGELPSNIFVMMDQLDYSEYSSGLKTLGYTVDETFQGVSRNRYYADIPIQWNRLVYEERNDRVPFYLQDTATARVANGNYLVHDLAAALETQLNLNVGEWIFTFNLIKSAFVIKADRLIRFLFDSGDDDNTLFGFPPDSSSSKLWTHTIVGLPVSTIAPVLNYNNLSVTIKEKRVVVVNIPDLVGDSLESAVTKFQDAINSSALTNNYTVSLDNQNNVFVLECDNIYTIAGYSGNFGLSYGLTLLQRESTIQYGIVPHYPSINLNTVSTNNIRVYTTSEQATVTPGTYGSDSFVTKLQANLNTNMPIATWMVSYDSDSNTVTVDEDSGNVALQLSEESVYRQLGIPLNIIIPGGFPITFPNISVMDFNKYIFIKSYALSQSKEENFNASPVYENVVSRVLINAPYKSTENIYFNGLNQVIFPLNISYLLVDFRLEFANGRLVELNGQDWSLTTIFAQF